MTKPRFVEFTEDEVAALDKEADELSRQFVELVRSTFSTYDPDRVGILWRLMLNDILFDWLAGLEGDNEAQTRKHQARQLKQLSFEVLRGLAKICAAEAPRNIH